jgi:DNA-binding IclR family transcriptional regulator
MQEAPRRALSATRALRVLDYLAEHSGEAHTLSALAREIEVNPSSLYSVLNVLE